MKNTILAQTPLNADCLDGGFVTRDNQQWYCIRNYHLQDPFFISLVSAYDHWNFLSTTGGLSCGRCSPDHALFPYYTVDKITENAGNTGPVSAFWVGTAQGPKLWEPFQSHTEHLFKLSRNLYKHELGTRLIFEEINHSLGLAFEYEWSSGAQYGFIRRARLRSLTEAPVAVDLMDGLRNLLPSGLNRRLQNEYSCLADAYKRAEAHPEHGLALYTMASGITDRAEPMEVLRATTVFCLGLKGSELHLSEDALRAFRKGMQLDRPACELRGRRGAFLLWTHLELDAQGSCEWFLAAEIDQDQSAVGSLQRSLQAERVTPGDLLSDALENEAELEHILQETDGVQKTAHQDHCQHHRANVLFNDMRGGVFQDGYQIDTDDFAAFVAHFNQEVQARHAEALTGLSGSLARDALEAWVRKLGDADLLRLFYEFLPITFARRHGDPSRPWNQFKIRVRDEQGRRVQGYQGNWRDIFQNWESLCLSYPAFLPHIIAKFVNASTVDGFNPYRITHEGIDWEVPEPDNPWASIGYWGDHQIIYLLRLLEGCQRSDPGLLDSLLGESVYSYADVPYCLRSYGDILANPRDSIAFDRERHEAIEAAVDKLGADARLVGGRSGHVTHVNLLEKLLVPMLSKLANYVPGGGIWMNTLRPEWNDANNALAGYGLSLVTLAYLHRYVSFLSRWLESLDAQAEYALSNEVADLLESLSALFAAEEASELLQDDRARKQFVDAAGEAFEAYRNVAYQEGFSGVRSLPLRQVRDLLARANGHLAASIAHNRREDGLFESYNLLKYNVAGETMEVLPLYEMLEGQVAVLSSGALSPTESVSLLENLRASALYREDQKSYLLYPDRPMPAFLSKNRIDRRTLEAHAVYRDLIGCGNTEVIQPDGEVDYRFEADCVNRAALLEKLASVREQGGYDWDESALREAADCYEEVFSHLAFTGRSCSMFAYEGLGSIYWHMVAKLLLAVQESWQAAPAETSERAALQSHYYAIREGIGYKRDAQSYGAFPHDPYSHTPAHAGAQQPGMTGQVKEEILTRFGELGVQLADGRISFDPELLEDSEWLPVSAASKTLRVGGQQVSLEPKAPWLLFSFCGLPICYERGTEATMELQLASGDVITVEGHQLARDVSRSILHRTGELSLLTVRF